MYKRHKCLAGLLFFTSIIILFIIEIELTQAFIGHLITFFSIVFGFYITGLSILFGSNFSKRLWREEDPNKSTQTNFHTLLAYFRIGLFLLLSSIVLFLIISLIGMTFNSDFSIIPKYLTLGRYSFPLERVITAVSLGIATTNIMFMYLLLKIFLSGFLDEASTPK